jgi:hypothetical protein
LVKRREPARVRGVDYKAAPPASHGPSMPPKAAALA